MIDSFLAVAQGDAAAGMRLLGEGEELARRLHAGAELAYAAYIRGMGALFANELPVAVEILDRAWTTLSGVPDLDRDLDLDLTVLTTLRAAAGLAGDYERASACVRDAGDRRAPRRGLPPIPRVVGGWPHHLAPG